MYYQDFIFSYVLMFVIVGIIAIICVAVIYCSAMKKAERIAQEIVRSRASRVERIIIRDPGGNGAEEYYEDALEDADVYDSNPDQDWSYPSENSEQEQW